MDRETGANSYRQARLPLQSENLWGEAMAVCPVCSADLKAGDPAGLCPACLLAGAIGASSTSGEADAQTETINMSAPEPGSFGPYRILRVLGEGGMGTVYLAEQTEPIRRRIALKVVKAGMDTNQVLARFNHERQSLALMEHSNIARILDAGASPQGRPFFVMEYIEGEPITAHCDRRQLTIARRLELFLPICRAMQHAHNKGIIHRDIKPSNILVTVEDGQPIPKVIDFGIARAVEIGDSGQTLATQFGQMVGTPEYASPEQADLATGEIGTAADVYSLGVLLYEMLSGAVPFDGARLRKAGFSEMLRIIREEEPPSLAQKLTATMPDAGAVARRRGANAIALKKLLTGNLNWIVRKALEKSPQNRYASPSELAADIERHLSGKPVLAGPPSRIWRVGKPVLAAAAAALLILIPASWLINRALHSPPPAGITSAIVLSDVANDTGDSSFDGSFRQTLSFELQHSATLTVLQDGRVAEILSEMRKARGTRQTPPIAREICERTGSAAYIESSLSKTGARYLLTLRARNCTVGDVIGEEQAQASGKEDVLDELRRLTARLQSKSGPSFAELQKHATPLVEATTTSLEALKSFSVGRDQHYVSPADGLLLLKRAVELDPEFALAYAWLGRSYADNGQQNLAMETIAQGYRLRGLASDRENYFITYNYDREVLRNLELCRQLCEAWIGKYPRDTNPHGFLSGLTSRGTNRYEQAIAEGEKALAVNPKFSIGYQNIAEAYLSLNRRDQVKVVIQRAAERKLGSKDHLPVMFFTAFLDRDQSTLARLSAELAAASPFGNAEHLQSLAAASEGRLQRSRQASVQAVQLARQAHYTERAALYEGGAAIREAVYGYPDAASQRASAAQQLAGGRDADFPPAFALALSGKSALALPFAARMERQYPEDTFVHFNYSPALRALIAINEGNPAKAIELVTISKTYEFGQTGVSIYYWYGALYPTYVRGLAYRLLHKNREAAAEFRSMLDHPGVLLADPIGAATRVQLARALRDAGDIEGAKAAYRDFFALWKDADDPEIPLLHQAKSEYARL
jgi:serine/threonine protein kinase